MRLSILIAALNDPDINNTIASIRATAGSAPQIIVVDDCSNIPIKLDDKDAILIQNIDADGNRVRIGCGASRHVAAQHATGDFLCITDAHMRFSPGWYETAMDRITQDGRENVVHCGVCGGLDAKNPEITPQMGKYYGARMNLFGPNPNNPKEFQIFEGVWNSTIPDDDAEISCLMGASYFFNREWFFHIGGLKALKVWGSDEPYLTLKTYLAGGSVRLMRDVVIGHKFHSGSVPYKLPFFWKTVNKMRSLMTCTNKCESQILLKKFGREIDMDLTLSQLKRDKDEIIAEYHYNHSIFVHDLQWFCSKFGLEYPT